MRKKEKGSGFYRDNEWILFKKADGRIGVLAAENGEPQGEIIMRVRGDFDKACRYAEDIENDVSTQYSVFDFVPQEKK